MPNFKSLTPRITEIKELTNIQFSFFFKVFRRAIFSVVVFLLSLKEKGLLSTVYNYKRYSKFYPLPRRLLWRRHTFEWRIQIPTTSILLIFCLFSLLTEVEREGHMFLTLCIILKSCILTCSKQFNRCPGKYESVRVVRARQAGLLAKWPGYMCNLTG